MNDGCFCAKKVGWNRDSFMVGETSLTGVGTFENFLELLAINETLDMKLWFCFKCLS